ncbi:MAG: MBL fold metallo-hydrolase, partial [Arenicellales bacterium]
MSAIAFQTDHVFSYGVLETVGPGIRRLTARNPSAFTFHGTGTYVVGEGRVAVIDPGPDDPAHIQTLVASLAKERIT